MHSRFIVEGSPAGAHEEEGGIVELSNEERALLLSEFDLESPLYCPLNGQEVELRQDGTMISFGTVKIDSRSGEILAHPESLTLGQIDHDLKLAKRDSLM